MDRCAAPWRRHHARSRVGRRRLRSARGFGDAGGSDASHRHGWSRAARGHLPPLRLMTNPSPAPAPSAAQTTIMQRAHRDRWHLVDQLRLVDDNMSGPKTARDEFEELLAPITAGDAPITPLYVRHRDRVARASNSNARGRDASRWRGWSRADPCHRSPLTPMTNPASRTHPSDAPTAEEFSARAMDGDAPPAVPVHGLAASYARKSEFKEAAIDAQHTTNVQRAHRDGWQLVDQLCFADDNTSGLKTTRDGMEDLLALIMSGKAPFRAALHPRP